jgi:sterol desaturase/sphingolipid hydroxylase (fatty acid hydroxylase superfamily)
VAELAATEMMTAYTDPLLTFLMLLGAVYGVTVALYFIYGLSVTWLNNRNPERRIQKTRRGEKRMWVEIKQSMISIFVTSTSVAFGIFAQHMGWTPTPWTLTWWNALPIFFLCMVVSDLWFYTAHRLLHTKLFYRHHAWHHRSVAPTAWSHDSMTVIDTALSQAHHTLMVFLIPFPSLIILANRAYDQINGTFGHAGFEYFASPTSRFPSPMLCVFFHDQHHSEFRYNYGNYFSFWDRVFGTIAPDYDSRVKVMESEDLPLRPLIDKGRQPAE